MNSSPYQPNGGAPQGENVCRFAASPSHDEVLADIAHGLQTPLAALHAHLTLMFRKHPRNRRAKVCTALAEDMSEMVKDLVRLARTDTTVRASSQEKIDAGALVESITEYMGVLAESKGIKLLKDIEPDICVVGAAKQLEETLMNLINNSIKYMDAAPEGRNGIFVGVKSTEDACLITIKDTGIGIDADELPHVFTRFYRTRAGSARAAGSGLGLAIAKKTIEAHGGNILIESTSGRGTCVTCSIPLLEPRLPLSQCAPVLSPPLGEKTPMLRRTIRDRFLLRF